uniref:Indole-3-glycerol-phosphate synthase n=2 Tax=Lotharella globosa TaxID=91324 RepID=A0A7S3Z6H0_9EUKA
MSALKTAVKQLTEAGGCTPEEAGEAVKEIMSGEGNPLLTASFLTALRWDKCTPEIVSAVAKSMRDYALPCKPELKKDEVLVDVVGTGGDGFDTFNVSTCASIVLAAAGAKVLKHGNRSNASKCGSADILEAMGANLMVDGAQASKVMEECGFCFLFAQKFHPSMKHVAKVRRAMGVRTIFNILGPLTNPARPTVQLTGVFSKNLGPLYIQVMKASGMKRAMVVHSKEGLDELSIAGPTYAWILDDGKITEKTVSPPDFGLPCHSLDKVAGKEPTKNMRTFQEIMEGKKGPCMDFVLLNASCALWVAGLAPDFKQATEKARNAIESGKAKKVLEDYIKLSNTVAGIAYPKQEKKEEKSILHTIADHRLAVVKDLSAKVPFPMVTVNSLGTPAINVLNRIEVGKMGRGKIPDIVALMAEIKRASPSKGDINIGVDVVRQALIYAKSGASVISVLTEPKWFKGTIKDLRAVKEATMTLENPPCVLLKDFVVDEYQILEARMNGADLVLLIVTLLPLNKLKHFIHVSRSLGMEPLVECAREDEVKTALAAGAKFIGINNRNLKTFHVDMDTTGRLAKMIPKEVKLAALSGIKTRADVEKFYDVGAAAVLVGETLMRAKDPADTIVKLVAGKE